MKLYKVGSAAGQAALTASAPLRSTDAYKAVAAEITEALDDAASNVQHGGYVEKEDRRRRREARLIKAGKAGGLGARKVKTEINLECAFLVVRERYIVLTTVSIAVRERQYSSTRRPTLSRRLDWPP